MLNILRNRKANSVCGDRDSILIRKLKKKFAEPGLMSSRRSLSIYSERLGEDVKKFEWRYRVKNRDHIPNFFTSNLEND